MSVLLALFLGLVQGLTEFIPVSSSGHLELVQQIFGERGADFHIFLELINFGTLIALIIFFRKRIQKILIDIFKEHNYRLAINVIITCIPAGLVGLALGDFIETNPFFSSLITVSTAMLIVGVLMILADKLPHLKKIKNENHLTRGRALGIGCAQVFALIPGVSRSGSTILAGRVVGMDSKAATEYSFLVSIPLMTAVCLKTLVSSSARTYLFDNFGILAAANLVALISGLLALRLVMNYVKSKDSLRAFGIYRVIVGAIVLIYQLIQ